jgi:hypothetical protein
VKNLVPIASDCTTRTKPPLASDTEAPREQGTTTSTPEVEEAPSPSGFVNHEKKHRRCPHIAVARGSGIYPELTFNLQIQPLPPQEARSSTRSAADGPHPQHGPRHPPAHRQPQQTSGRSSCTPSPFFPTTVETTAPRRGREGGTKVHSKVAAAPTTSPRHFIRRRRHQRHRRKLSYLA